MRKFTHTLIAVLIVIAFPFTVMGQYITGNTTPAAGTQHTYSYNTGTVIFSPQWQLSNGLGSITNQSQNGTTYSATITWNTAGSETLVLFDAMYGPVDQLNITVTAAAPPAPTAGAATNITGTSFTANWSYVSSATGYRLDVSTVNNFASFVTGYNNLLVSPTSQSVTGLSPGTTYYYRVRSINASGTSTNSGTISTITQPAAPATSAASSITATAFTANWATTQSATSYRLDVSTVNTFATFVSGFNNLTVAGTAQSVSGLAEGTTYYYRVRAVNASGTSASSSTATTLTLPPAPASGSPSSMTASSFIANWAAALSATGYRIDVSTVNTFASFVTGYNDLSVAGTALNVTGLATGTTYYYRVRAVNASGTSGNSSTASSITVLNPPTAIDAASITSSSFLAKWNAATNAISYQLDVSTLPDFSVLVSGYSNLAVGGTSQNVVGLLPKKSYYYRVRAVNAATTSGNSNVIVGADMDYNYVRSVDIVVPNKTTPASVANPTITDGITSYNFFDGLGRPTQTIAYQGSPSQKDIVQPIAYDVYGRDMKKYLPYTDETNGWFKPNALRDPTSTGTETAQYITGKQYTFYQTGGLLPSDEYPYAEARVEPSPENRLLEQGSPGLAWQPDATDSYTSADKTIKSAHETNVDGEVLMWAYTYPTASYPLGLVNTGSGTTAAYYTAGMLHRSRTKDEQQNEVIEYKDQLGKVVLKRVQFEAGTPAIDDDNYASTYYVYDGFGNLVTVIPPEATKRLAAEYYHSGATDATKDAYLSRWAFRYTYDAEMRMSQKQVPGASPVYIVYDKRDRAILTQDGKQRSGTTKYWTFTKYDLLNRPILTGIKDTAGTLTQEQMQGAVNSFYAKAWAKYGESYIGNVAGNLHGYTNKSYPVVTSGSAINSSNYQTVTYYDNYEFRSMWKEMEPYTYLNDALSVTVNGVPYNQPTVENLRVTGQPTGLKVKVLDGGVTGGYTWLKSINYYDDKYRLIQSKVDNYKGGVDRVSNLYDFAGKVLKTMTTHVERDVKWIDLVGVKQEGNKLTRTLAGQGEDQAGAASAQQLAAGQDGWMEFVASETDLYRMIGFSDANTDNSYLTLDYGWYPRINGIMEIYQNGGWPGQFGSYSPGDVFRIERTGTTIKYYHNNDLKYTSLVPSSGILMVDACFYSSNSSVVNVRSSFSTTTKIITRRFEYDHSNRLIRTWHKIDAQPEILLALNSYNELGQLVDKKLHSTVSAGTDSKQSVDYRYNIRGWLTSLNNSELSNDGVTNDDAGDYFGMNLGYNQDLGIGNSPLYNGNISAMKWNNFLGQAAVKEKSFAYTYDPMNRITSATFMEKTGSWNLAANSGYTEPTYTYDLNGNIKTLTRYDKRGTTGAMDNMAYDYGTGTTQSNKLLSVTDSGDDFMGFIDGANAGDDYTYDANGNMITDQNKGITSVITYNYLNLPELITRGGNTIRYIYDAAGRKISQLTVFGAVQKQTDYVGEFIYENDVLQFVQHEEGRIVIATQKDIYVSDCGSLAGIVTNGGATPLVVNQNGNQTYVRITSNGTLYSGIFPLGGVLPVVPGERYKIRVKGYKTSTEPVYILAQTNVGNINWDGSFWGGSPLPGTAATEAWIEETITIPTGATTLSVGVIWYTSVNGSQFFINDANISQLKENTTPEYQYNLKDHLGNVRVTFTTKDETINYPASLENSSQTNEQATFKNYSRVTADLFDHSDAGTTYDKAQLLNGGNNSQVGLSKSLAVMPGDVVSAEVWAKHYGATGSSGNLTGFASALLSAFGLPAPAGGELGTASAALQTYGSFIASGGNPGNSSWPKGFLNILIFDKDYNLVDLAYQQLDAAYVQPVGDPTKQPHQLLSLTKTIKEPGYVYIYLSNEGSVQKDIYFDDMAISHTKSKILQTDDYYPFGLTFNSYRRENSPPNLYQYNGKERQDELDLGWYDFLARQYDPTIARWMAVDPLADLSRKWSPYTYCYNSPLLFVDPDGMFGDFYDQAGNKLGTDGKKDEKVYVVTDTKEVESIWTNDQIGETTQVNAVSSAIELPSASIRDQMGQAVDRSNSPTTSEASNEPGFVPDPTGGTHEEGGTYGTAGGKDVVVNAVPGSANPEVDPRKDASHIQAGKAADPSSVPQGFRPKGTFHVHPSGVKDGRGFTQTPSDTDRTNTTNRSSLGFTGNDFVLGARNNTVYILNSSGGTATFPLDKFRSIGNK